MAVAGAKDVSSLKQLKTLVDQMFEEREGTGCEIYRTSGKERVQGRRRKQYENTHI